MGLTILVGCVWSFGAARLSVGYLNTATGFLVSIIAGNGINFGIVYMARYLEARSVDGLDVAESIRIAHLETYGGTLAAAAAAMVAYGSLSITTSRARGTSASSAEWACCCAGSRPICCYPRGWLPRSGCDRCAATVLAGGRGCAACTECRSLGWQSALRVRYARLPA